MSLVTIQVNKEAIESGNAELLLCEARDFLEAEEELDKQFQINQARAIKQSIKALKEAQLRVVGYKPELKDKPNILEELIYRHNNLCEQLGFENNMVNVSLEEA
tara:strand:- start:133 stop:444 length:312 start_codon:yes stop_codon:yes gene_type:complete